MRWTLAEIETFLAVIDAGSRKAGMDGCRGWGEAGVGIAARCIKHGPQLWEKTRMLRILFAV